MARRCELIVAVDAEAHPAMGFGSLLKFECFARSDLGAIIELRWWAIHDWTLAVDAAFAKGEVHWAEEVHVAACNIRYGEARMGVLLYMTSSWTGDENHFRSRLQASPPGLPAQRVVNSSARSRSKPTGRSASTLGAASWRAPPTSPSFPIPANPASHCAGAD